MEMQEEKVDIKPALFSHTKPNSTQAITSCTPRNLKPASNFYVK